MGYFAVIDTETNWEDVVMSIGLIIAEEITFKPVLAQYYIVSPEYKVGGMFSDALYFTDERFNYECSRQEAIRGLRSMISKYGVSKLFAYNASFDYRHLPELADLAWYDIMALAAYKQHNPMIPDYLEVFGTGRMKRGYGVESMLRLMMNDASYNEEHNALTDALDELKIMKLLGHRLDRYKRLKVKVS